MKTADKIKYLQRNVNFQYKLTDLSETSSNKVIRYSYNNKILGKGCKEVRLEMREDFSRDFDEAIGKIYSYLYKRLNSKKAKRK